MPEDPWQQLRLAIEAVFRSWDSARARTYRQKEGISDDLGTAAEVLWAAMHGLATLQRAGRVRPDQHQRRVDELVRLFAG